MNQEWILKKKINLNLKFKSVKIPPRIHFNKTYLNLLKISNLEILTMNFEKIKNLWLILSILKRCGSKLANPETYIKLIHYNI